MVKPVSKPVKVDRRSSSLDRALTGYLKDQSVRKDYQVAEDSRLERQPTEDSDDSTLTNTDTCLLSTLVSGKSGDSSSVYRMAQGPNRNIPQTSRDPITSILELMQQQQQTLQTRMEQQQTRMETSDRRIETLLTHMTNTNLRTATDSGSGRDDGDLRGDDYDTSTSRGTFKLQLPKMEKVEDMCKFIKRLEVVLTRNGVDRDAWLDCLVSQISQEASEAVIALLMEDDCAYEDVKNVLLSRSGYSSVTASENFFANLDTSKEVELGMRLEDVCEWSEKVMEGAGSIIEGAHMIGRARARQDLADSLKYEIDSRKPNCNSGFITCCMEWQARQPPNTSVFKRPSSRDRPAPYRVGEKGGLRCFKCRKQRHVSKQCWATPSREPDKTERSEGLTNRSKPARKRSK